MLPNLGVPSLWDVDEGVNAECAREMREVGTWIVPTFNYELRTAKPVFLYWAQRLSYDLVGVSEWAARFPAVLFSVGTVLVTATLGRRLFGPATGLLAGVITATCFELVKLAHAATPDAPLIFFVTLTLYWFWVGHEGGKRTWFYTAPIACALAVLTKGPAFFGLTGLIIFLYLAWCRDLKRLLDTRLITGFLIFLLVAAPWYGAVAAETRGAWPRAFFGTENAGRFTESMEGHDGKPFYVLYYVVCLMAFFAPWSLYLASTVVHAVRKSRRVVATDQHTELAFHRPYRFLLCWFAVILIGFSAAATKLPNYVATLYPSLALLTADFFVRWRAGTVTLPRWSMPAGAVAVGLTGVGFTVGLLVAGGTIPVSPSLRTYPALAPFAALGFFYVLGSIGMLYFLRKGDRDGYVVSLVASTVLFVGFLAAYPPAAFDQYKAPRELVRESGAFDPERDIRVASFDYTQPSVTFYVQRKVTRLKTPSEVNAFLGTKRQGYLFVPARAWAELEPQVDVPFRVAARRFDFLRNGEVLVIANE